MRTRGSSKATIARTAAAAAAAGTLLLAGAGADAATVYDAAPLPTKANNTFISGSGIPSNGFAVDTDPGTGVSVALKARSRDTGQPVSIVGDTYTVLNGLAADNTNPSWSFDFQFSPGAAGTLTSGYKVFLDVDFDPAPNAVDVVTIGGTVPVPGVFSTIANPGPGAWSDDAVDFVVADSWHLGFGFWNTIFGKGFDPNAQGEYDVTLRATAADNTPLASSTITVVSVPEPTGVGLLVLAGGAMLLRRRRQ